MPPRLFPPRHIFFGSHTVGFVNLKPGGIRSFRSTSPFMAQNFKIKGLTALDLKNGEKREVELDGVENGKVLLARVGNKTHALSSNCTHYGAPLKNGVLTPEGRLTCPWHGACFNVATGDVEDAPALDSLAKFDIVEKDGGVYIEGDEATIKASRRQPNVRCSVQGPEKVIVVGGGSGAMGAVQGLREMDFKGSITMISSEPNLPVDRTKLSKALIPDASKIELRPKDWFKTSAIDLVSDEVSSVDFKSKSVSTASGSSYSYTKLILATGGSPKVIPGFKQFSNVFCLRSIPDVRAILSAVGEEKKKNVVVIGSSFIGMEVANSLSANNKVTVIGMEGAPLQRVMGADVGKIFQSNLEKNNVKFYMDTSVDSPIPSSSNSKMVGAVKLQDGTSLPADLVILGIGVAPATGYLKDNEAIKLRDDGSLHTSESFAVEGLQDVYAIGDIATYPYHGPGGNGSLTRIEHWNVAQNAGRSVARTITSPSEPPKPFIPVFWSAQGGQLRYCGNTPNGWDDMTLQGEPRECKFAAFYGKNGTVVAVASMSMDPVVSQSAELMRHSKMPSMQQLKDGLDVRDISLPAEIAV